jgi:hypothetical protein
MTMAKSTENQQVAPFFDTCEFIKKQTLPKAFFYDYHQEDFNHAKLFLLSYKHVETTFNAYRREIERLLHWTWHIAYSSENDRVFQS